MTSTPQDILLKRMLSTRMRDRLVSVIIIAAGLWGLWLCAPGFRPKHVRDIVVGLTVIKGPAIAVYFGILGLLVPAADRIRRMGLGFATNLGSLFVLLSVLFAADVFVGIGFESKYGGTWVMRILYIAFVVWGFSDFGAVRALAKRTREKLAMTWTGLPHWGWKVFLVLVTFFLIRQEMHLYLYRFAVKGDEVSWWHTGAKEIMNNGLFWTMRKHEYGYYTPSIPWLIAFPNRIIGAHIEELLWGFPLFAMCVYGFLLLELARTAMGFLAGWTLVFYIFLSSRDLMHMFGAFFYGEAITAGLVGILAAQIYALLRQRQELVLNWKSALSLGLFSGFCIMAKPPISSLIPLVLVGFAAVAIWKRYFQYILPVFLAAYLPQQVWKHKLATIGKLPEYSFNLRQIIDMGVDLAPVWMMIKGLFMWGSFQTAFFSGMILALVVVALRGERRLFWLMFGVIFVYWGSVFGLYATLWQRGDFSSCGRYISHAAIGVTLLVPLAFRRPKEAQ